MKFIYNEHANKSGVYKITNKINGKIYIGSAKLFKVRARQHLSSLKNNKHQNKYFQRSFNEYGEEAFEFEVIEVVEGSTVKRRKIEQKYLDEQIKLNNWDNCYNLNKKTVLKQKIWSKNPTETKEKISKIRKGKTYKEIYGEEKAAQVKQKISNSHIGKVLTEKHKKKISKNAKTNPNYGLKNKKLSEETKKKISQSRLGKKHWFYGRTLPKQQCEKMKKKYITKLISPTGKIITEIFGLNEFCKEHNLSRFALRAVMAGRRLNHNGWKLLK